jgi:hypothetical protein
MRLGEPIFAYIDPGTGSYVFQLALAGMLGASYAVRHFWGRIRTIFSRGAAPTDDARR